MRSGILVVITLMALRITACSPRIARPGILQDFSNACDKANEGQEIAVEGYLRLPDVLTSSNSVELRLYRDATFSGKPIGVTMRFGNGPNEATKITTAYQDKDLQVHLANGTAVPFRTRVRVSGRMYYPLVPQDFACGLENPYVEPAK